MTLGQTWCDAAATGLLDFRTLTLPGPNFMPLGSNYASTLEALRTTLTQVAAD